MNESVRITLFPLSTTFEVERGTSLRDVLFPHGVEFPCGGRGRCKGCRVRVTAGQLAVTEPQRQMLPAADIEAGWRLACQCRAESDLTLELAQWETSVLADERQFTFTPREGLGIAIDVGTTTLVAQLVDLRTGVVLSVRTALNPQARYGADIMSRITAAVVDGARQRLVELIRKQTGKMIAALLGSSGLASPQVSIVALVGNTVMHHLFCDLDLTSLSYYPFESTTLETGRLTCKQLGWMVPGNPEVLFLPCPGGFVGSDILAGVLATGLHEHPTYSCLIDLGTNGEIVVGNRDRILCCSTAAGPAFEGAGIAQGMRASTGAISEVSIADGKLVCSVLGNTPPRGICGSGLVDAVACMLDLGLVRDNGSLANDAEKVPVCSAVALTQSDIRQLQLAKGAIAAGVQILLRMLGMGANDVSAVYLAGAFGNYVSSQSARRIGLLAFHNDQIIPAGNTALHGAKIALFRDPEEFARLRQRMEHVPLSNDNEFEDTFVNEMGFPPSSPL